MHLFDKLNISGHIEEAVIHFNQACDTMASNGPIVEVARTLFDSLNKIQTEWLLGQPDQQMGEIKAFQSMILDELQADSRTAFLQSSELQNLVLFEPQIMNHDTLRRVTASGTASGEGASDEVRSLLE